MTAEIASAIGVRSSCVLIIEVDIRQVQNFYCFAFASVGVLINCLVEFADVVVVFYLVRFVRENTVFVVGEFECFDTWFVADAEESFTEAKLSEKVIRDHV